MNKNTQILLGVGVFALIGYFVYQNNKSDKKANAIGGKGKKNKPNNCPCQNVKKPKKPTSNSYDTSDSY